MPHRIPDRIDSKTKKYQHASVWIGAIAVGVAAALYAKAIGIAQNWFFSRFSEHPRWISALTPLFFLLSVTLVRRFAPDAKGSGIPQVLEAIAMGREDLGGDRPWRSSLISLRTAGVKVISSLVAILGGASIGREGPTIQIAASVFGSIGRFSRKYAPQIELPSYLTAGAAAGVAAAFNTPLAGITFAIEEVVDGAFGNFRQTMIISVILAGITAQALLGDYLYFGRPDISPPDFRVLYQSLLIGVICGALGGGFARILAYPRITRLPEHWAWRAILCGTGCAGISYLTHGATAGSGYEPTEKMLAATATLDSASIYFPLQKLATTVLSYLSGMAGGIFSPSLSIGAGVGISIAKILNFANFRACALMGMVAFFSGVVQAPLTAVIIVTEMTDRHVLIIPFLIAAFVGHGTGRLLMPVPLYHFLSKRSIE